jgi:hypothetical protein
MHRYLMVALAALLGLLVGGATGGVAGQAPVFQWELVPLVLIVFAGLGGLVSGALSSLSGRMSLGAIVGAVGVGLLFALSSRADSNPVAITIWGTAVVASAAVLASGVGASLRRWAERKQGIA